MKILLIAPHFSHPDYPQYLPSENLGIAYIAAVLREHKYKVDIIDLNFYGISANMSSSIVDYSKYDIVGISVNFQLLHNEAIALANIVKNVNPKCFVVMGGHYPTFSSKLILQVCYSVDVVIRGEGEYTFLEIAQKIGDNSFNSLSNILGITYRCNGEVYYNQDRPLISDLDTIPLPCRDSLNQMVLKLNHSVPTQISTSRGCFGKCSFCDIRAFYNSNWRGRSPKSVVDEIEYLQNNYGSKLFRLSDDESFGCNRKGKERLIEIAREIIRRGLKVELMISARATDVDHESFRLLKQAGVINCLIGIESGCDRLLKLYNKNCDVETNKRAIRILKDLGIDLYLAFIMFDPRMTYEELRQNYNFLKENDILDVDSLKSNLWILNGTEDEKYFIRNNLLYGDFYNPLYHFMDDKVEIIYNHVEQFKKATFTIEKHIYKSRVNGKVNSSWQNLISKYKELWVEFFENLLEFDFIDLNKNINETKKIQRKMEILI